MSNQVAKKEATHLTVAQPHQGQETILKSDVVIPKLLLMQGLSELVNERKAQQGDIVRSTTGEKLGDDKTAVEIIPLTFKNVWILQEKVGKKYEYRGLEPRTAANEAAPWEFEQNGAEWKRTKAVDVFAILPKDVDAELVEIKKFQDTGEIPDLNKTLLPVVVRFQSTSFKAGRDIVTHFTKAAGMAKYGVKPYSVTVKLKCYQDKNDKGTFFVFETAQGTKVNPAQLERAEEWYKIVTSQNVQVDESDVREDEDMVAARKAQAQRAREVTDF